MGEKDLRVIFLACLTMQWKQWSVNEVGACNGTEDGEERWSSAKRRRVVVIGGGVGGSLTAKSLQFCADVVLIDPKEYFEIPWVSLRSMVEPTLGDRLLINQRDYPPNARAVMSKAIEITESEVLTADGHLFAYDYLVISTGHQDPVPIAQTERLKQFEADNPNIKFARSILIIGGGPVGVELAAEIAVDFPDKKITLVHSGSRLMEFIGPKASEKTLDWLRMKSVDVKLEQLVDLTSLSDGKYATSHEETIKADCHFLCTGKPLASSWLKETFSKKNLDRFGRLLVEQCMRVKGRDNIFAVGDITDVRNLKLLMDRGKESKTAAYKPCSAKAIVSLGRREAVAQFSLTTVIGRIPGTIKSKDLFVGKTRKLMGLKPDIVYS